MVAIGYTGPLNTPHSSNLAQTISSIFYILTYFKPYTYRVLLGKPEGRRPLGRPRRRWVDNIRMDL